MTTSASNGRYNYSRVAQESRSVLEKLAREIRSELSVVLAARLRIGKKLLQARSMLPHGEWTPWLMAETGMSETWSRECMDLHKFSDRRPEALAGFDKALARTAVVRLATAAPAAVGEVLERVRRGEPMRVVDVEKIISQFPDERRKKVVSHSPIAANLDVEEVLRDLGSRGSSELIPEIIARMYDVLNHLEDAQDEVAQGRRPSRKGLEKAIREHSKWLTEALEQLTQRCGPSATKVVHVSFLNRIDHDPGPWADATAFLRDYSSSHGWEKVKSAHIQDLVSRGRKALAAALMA